MNAQVDPNPEMLKTPTSRRAFLRRAGLASAVAAVAPAAAAFLAGRPDAKAVPATDIDEAVLNFALQTEYLGAQYYCYAATGVDINANAGAVDGAGTQGTVIIKENPQVPFRNPLIQQLANEFAVDELGHVNFLRNTLAAGGFTYYSMPMLDLRSSYDKLAQKAGFADSFDPFTNDATFMVGAFIIEDVDVTAYAGSATLITNPNYLLAAAGILAVEAYHAGAVRTRLYNMSQQNGSTADYGFDIIATTRMISDLRNRLSGGETDPSGLTIAGVDSDAPILVDNSSNIIPSDTNSIAFERNTREVLNILYGDKGATNGGFFPNGLNGLITS
jgi:hypothetical protein